MDEEFNNKTNDEIIQDMTTDESGFAPENETASHTESSYSSYSSYEYQQTSAASDPGSTNAYPVPKKKRPLLTFFKFVAAAACFGVIAGGAFCGVNYVMEHYVLDSAKETAQSNSNHDYVRQDGLSGSVVSGTGAGSMSVSQTAQSDTSAETVEDDVVVRVVEENIAATVSITGSFTSTTYYWGQPYSQKSTGSGSGFIVGISDTDVLVATNNHVVDGASDLKVTFYDGSELNAVVRGTDASADLAIISVSLDQFTEEALSSIRVVSLGDSDSVKVGQMAIAIGNALGYGQSVTVGYISARDREVTVDGNTLTLLQTDAAINNGNSGGPLFNTKGEVIGINAVKYSDTSVEGMCFAIPISNAIPILNELMNREILTEEEQGYLGVSIRTVSSELTTYYRWPSGVYVAEVSEGGAAEQAGIYVGDIITSVNGVQVTTQEQLKSAVTSYRYGTTVEVTVQRQIDGSYQELTLSVTLQQNPNPSKSSNR